jgi:hypothetical protein
VNAHWLGLSAHWWTMFSVSYLFIFACWRARWRGSRVAADGLAAICFWIQAAADLLYPGGERGQLIALLPLALAIWRTWQWWKGSRRGRDKAAKLLGDKSRALRDALVRRAREITVPRPVLAPQLYGGPPPSGG